MSEAENGNKPKILNSLLNRLKDPILCSNDLLGIICFIIYSKDIFKNNQQVEFFIKEVFGISYANYVLRSRTLIVARTTKYVYLTDDKDRENIQSKIAEFIKTQQLIEPIIEPKPKHNKKENANDKLVTWLKGL